MHIYVGISIPQRIIYPSVFSLLYICLVSAIEQREALLEEVRYKIAVKQCKANNYARIGKPKQHLDDQIITLFNYEFVLCGADLDCDVIDCISCAVQNLI